MTSSETLSLDQNPTKSKMAKKKKTQPFLFYLTINNNSVVCSYSVCV